MRLWEDSFHPLDWQKWKRMIIPSVGRVLCQNLWRVWNVFPHVQFLYFIYMGTAEVWTLGSGKRVVYWCNQFNRVKHTVSPWHLDPRVMLVKILLWVADFIPYTKDSNKKRFPPFVYRGKVAISLLPGLEREKSLPLGEGMGRILDFHTNILENKNISPKAS